MNMKDWARGLIAAREKTALPVLTFPSVQLLGITVQQLISDAERQAEGMAAIAARCDTAAALAMMDLSVEAEAFGSAIRVTDDEVPTVVGHIVDEPEDADALAVPAVGAGRTGLYIDGVVRAKARITDRPVLAGVIGPFSLAARLMGVSEAMMNCYEEPEMVETVMEKATRFAIDYAKAYRDAGADGIVMAEPASGLLSPALMEEFSTPYVRRVIEAVQDDSFAVIFHNCGGSVVKAPEQIASLGAMGYHFGNSIRLREMLEALPDDVLVCGNVDPAGVLCNGTPERVREETRRVIEDCRAFANFIPSSGCDIPPITPWENIDAFFGTVKECYS